MEIMSITTHTGLYWLLITGCSLTNVGTGANSLNRCTYCTYAHIHILLLFPSVLSPWFCLLCFLNEGVTTLFAVHSVWT